MSAELQNLIRRMLTVDPSRRITLEGIAGHSWMVRKPMMMTITPTTAACGAIAGGGGTSHALSSSSSSSSSMQNHRNPVLDNQIDVSARYASKGPHHVTYDNLQGIYSVTYNGQGEIEIDYDIVDLLVGHGFDADEVIDNVVGSECNYITTAYYLFKGKVRREIKRRKREQNNGIESHRDDPLDSGHELSGGNMKNDAGIEDRAGELTTASNMIDSSVNDSSFHEDVAAVTVTSGRNHMWCTSNEVHEEDLSNFNQDAHVPKPMSFQRPSSSSRPSSASIRRRPSPGLGQARAVGDIKTLHPPLMRKDEVVGNIISVQ